MCLTLCNPMDCSTAGFPIQYLWKLILITFRCIVLFSGSYFTTHEECLSSFLALAPPHQASAFARGSSQEHCLQTSGQGARCPPKVLITYIFAPLLTDTRLTTDVSQTSVLKAHCWMNYLRETFMNFWSPFKKTKLVQSNVKTLFFKKWSKHTFPIYNEKIFIFIYSMLICAQRQSYCYMVLIIGVEGIL